LATTSKQVSGDMAGDYAWIV